MKGVLVLYISTLVATLSYGQCNFTIAPIDAGEGCIETRESIVFENISRSAVNAHSITKTANGNAWNAGASSSSHVFVNGYVETIINQTNREKAFGLSTAKTSYNLNSIEFAFHLLNNGNIQIRESNIFRANAGTYANGDVLRVWNDNGTIKYLKNGEVIYTSDLTPAAALVLDVSLRTAGANFSDLSISNLTQGNIQAFATPGLGYFTWYTWTLNGTEVGNGNNQITVEDFADGDVLICNIFTLSGDCFGFQASNQIILNVPESNDPAFSISAEPVITACLNATEDVIWTADNPGNMAVNGPNITKIQGYSTWDCGAASANKVNNNGAFEFQSAENNRRKMAGLSHTNSASNEQSIQYAFYMESNGALVIYESGSWIGAHGNYTPGDVLKIAIEDNLVKYYRNGTLLRTSNNAPTLPLLADISMQDMGATIQNAKITNLSQGNFFANVPDDLNGANYQWKLNGSNVGTNASTYSNASVTAGDMITCQLTGGGTCDAFSIESAPVVISEVETSGSLEFFISGTIAEEACYAAQEAVRWATNNGNNIEIEGNELTKVQGYSTNDGGAYSLNKVGNNGYLTFSTNETNSRKMVGLSHTDPNNNENSIQYAFYLESNNSLVVYESGNWRGAYGSIAPGDLLKIAVENGIVHYYRNDVLLYVSNVNPTLPLLVDVSMQTQGATVTNAHILNLNSGYFTANLSDAGDNPLIQWKLNGANVGDNTLEYMSEDLNDGDVVACEVTPDLGTCSETIYTATEITIIKPENLHTVDFHIFGNVNQTVTDIAIEDVVWIQSSLQNVGVNGNDIVKTQGYNWDGGAASHNSVKNNGYLEFTTNENNLRKAIGLSSTNVNAHQNTIRYAFHLESNGQVRIYESGTHRGSFGTYSAGDVFRIFVDNNSVKYYRNGTLLRTVALAQTLPLLVDVSLNQIGSTLSNVVVANRNNAVFTALVTNAGDSPSYQWKLNGTPVGSDSPNYTGIGLFEGDTITCEITPDFPGCNTASFTSNKIVYMGMSQGTSWIGAISSAWSNGGNWSHGVPTQSMSARIPAGTPYSPKIDALGSVLNLMIKEGAVIGFGGENNLQIHGNFENYGTFECEDGAVAFSGTGSRMISGNSVSFNRFIVNLTSATDSIICDTDVSIRDETVFIRGRIYTGSNELVYLNNATTREGLSASYVEGTCRKIGNQAFKFPVGKNGIYAPVVISAPAQSTDEFTASYHDGSPDEAGYPHTTQDGTLSTVSQCEYWMVNRELGTSVVSVSLSYENERSCGVSDPSQLRVTRWDGAQWQNHGYLSHDGDMNAGVVTSGLPILNFSPFTLGSGSAINPLPIELLYFAAEAKGQVVDLEWTTLSEINNDYFTLERSTDGTVFEVIGMVTGAGNVQRITDYFFVDDAPLNGTSYYRLSQTDFNGVTESFPLQTVHIESINKGIIYPNPCSGIFTIDFAGVDKDRVINLYDFSGKLILSENSDKNIVQVHLPDQLAAGLYIVETTTSHHTERQRIIVN